MSEEPLSWQQKVFFQIIYDAFRKTGNWPTYDYVDRTLDSTYGIELEPLLRTLPQGLLRPDWPHISHIVRADHLLQPTIEGIAQWGGAWDDLNLLIRVLRMLIDWERRFVPSSPSTVEAPTVTSAEIEEALATVGRRPSQEELDRLLVLLDSDPLIHLGWGRDPSGSWQIKLSRELRRYRDVYDIHQYLERRRELAASQQAPPIPSTPSLDDVDERLPEEEDSDVAGPEHYWGRPAFVGLLAIFALVLGLAAALPVHWLWKALIVVVSTPMLMFLISLFSKPINRLATFLVRLPPPGPPVTSGGITPKGSLTLTVIRAGSSLEDPEAARVLSEDVNGAIHVEEVLPRDADVEKAMKDTIPRLMVPVRSLRAMRGDIEVARWTPNIWRRLRWSWGRRRM